MQNTVELIGTYGGDISHAMSAWTSTSRDIDTPDPKTGLTKRDRLPKLLAQLADAGHHTPFEKSTIHFLCTTDIASHIHLLKHRVGVSCVTGDTEIWIPRQNGGKKTKTIEELYEEYNNGINTSSKNGKAYKRKYGRKTPVRTKASDSNLVSSGHIKNVFYNGTREVYEFETKTGRKIKSTLDHRFYTPDGFQEIGEYLGVDIDNNVATFRNKNQLVAINGVALDVNNKPYSFRTWWNQFDGKTRTEVSKVTGYGYPLIKKWGYIHGIKFAKDINQDFKPGGTPWNKNRYGYKTFREKKGVNPNINKNLDYKIWRATVGNWTREQLPMLLEKYNYVCQAQLVPCSRDFRAHHIIPVSVNVDEATNIDNLTLVCNDCHKAVHKNYQAEINFAETVTKQDMKTVFANRKARKGRKLAYSYDEVIKVTYCGVQKVYDLEVEDTHCYVANGFLIHNCNGESARYKELKDDKFYVPTDWSVSQRDDYEKFMRSALAAYHRALKNIESDLVQGGMNVKDARKRAKESARFYLPYGNQITCDVSFNFRSLFHFLDLRYHVDAQKEIRDIARKMVELVHQQGDFNETLIAFGLLSSSTGELRGPFEG